MAWICQKTETKWNMSQRTSHLIRQSIKVRESRPCPFSLINVVIDIEDPSMVILPDPCPRPQALQQIAVFNHPIVESPASSESPVIPALDTPIASPSTSSRASPPMPSNNVAYFRHPRRKDDARELTAFDSEDEDQILESSPKHLPVPLAAGPDTLPSPTRLSPPEEKTSLAMTNDAAESVVSDSEAESLLSVTRHVTAASLSPDKEVRRPPSPSHTLVPSPGPEHEEEGPSFCLEEALLSDPTHLPAGTKGGASFSLSRSVSPIVAKDDGEVSTPSGDPSGMGGSVSSPFVLRSVSPLSSRPQIISPTVSAFGFMSPGAEVERTQADALFHPTSSPSVSPFTPIASFVTANVSRATKAKATQDPFKMTHQSTSQLSHPSTPPRADKSPTIRIPPFGSAPLVLPHGPITIPSSPINLISPVRAYTSPIRISSRESSPLSDLPSERDQDSDSDGRIVIPAKRRLKREMGGKGEGSQKRVLNVKVGAPGAPSAATTRVKKRKVQPAEKDMQPPLKRAREKVEQEGAGGSSNQGKMKMVVKGKDAKTPGACASVSPVKGKGSRKSLTKLGCKWPAVPKKGNILFKKQV